MMLSIEAYEEKFTKKTYAELIKERNRLIESMHGLEAIKKSGLDEKSAKGIYTGTFEAYKMNLEYLQSVIKLMNQKLQEDTLMVDEKDVDEQLEFVRNVIWKADSNEENHAGKRREAARILNKLMRSGNAEALNLRGAMYYEGRFEKQNQQRAVYWYRKAAEAGSSLAMSNLGYAYYYGNGIEADMQEAYKYFSMAVQRGEWDAYNMLGDMYRYGIYVPKDCDMALSLYSQCLDRVPHDESNEAYPGALMRIAECICEREENREDFELATELLNRAKEIVEMQAASGNYYAPFALERINKAIEEVEIHENRYLEAIYKRKKVYYPE